MKNQFKLFGLAVLVTAIVFSFAACKNDPEPLTDPALNGTWAYRDADDDDTTFVFNNGAFEMSRVDGVKVKGTFTTSGGSITLKPTHVMGTDGKWYTKAQLKAEGMDEDEIGYYFTPVTYTYSISGSTLTLDFGKDDPVPFTKQ